MYSLAVIVPNYNNEKYIAQCLNSILKQSLLPNEIIIVDDCSTDLSCEIINAYANKHPIIKPIFLKENGGVSNARNIGLHSTKCNYVTFIDADDFYFDNDKLYYEMELIKKSNRNVLVYSITRNVDENGELINSNFNLKYKRNQFILGNAKVWLVSMLKQARVPRDYCINREILINVGGYTFYKNFYEDLDLLMKLAFNKTKFFCTFKSGTAYRIKRSGLSHRDADEHKSTIDEITSKYFAKLNYFERLLYFIIVNYFKLKRHIRKFVKGY